MRRSGRELKEAMRHRRRALRADLQHQRQAAARQRPARRRRWPWVLLALVAIAVALLSECRCSDPGPDDDTGPMQPDATALPAPAPEPPVPLTGQMERVDRPDYRGDPPEVLPWLPAYRLQVAARSPRLAACFVGAEQPGRLRWSALVEPGDGRVSDHTLEPVLHTAVLSTEQRECVLGALSEPPYRLRSTEERSTPSRVGMVIEF